MKQFKKLFLSLLLIPVLLLSGCGFPGLGGSGNDGTVRIASQTSTESQIMANIIAELINHELGYKTTLVNNLGSSTVAHQACSATMPILVLRVTPAPILPAH